MSGLASKIRQIRIAKGLSLEDLANLIEPKPAKMTLSRLERGERKLTIDWASRIARALNVPVDELLSNNGSYITPEWLTAEMARRGLRRKDLAEVVGIPASGVTDLLAGRRNISIDESQKIADWIATFDKSVGITVATEAPKVEVPIFRMVEEAGFFRRSEQVGTATPFDGFKGFAVAYSGFDASPRYEEGDLLFVDTDRPARRGDYVFAISDQGFVSVRRFEGRDSKGFKFAVIDSGEIEVVPSDGVESVFLVRGSAVA